MFVLGLFLIWLIVSCMSSDQNTVRYDKNVNLFSSTGELLQVQYARNAGLRGSPILCSSSSGGEVLICIPTPSYLQALQDRRYIDKLTKVHDGIWFAFSGLAGDGRALMKAARSFCIEYQAKFGSIPSVRSVARYIGEIQHESTLSGGKRPFGVQVILIGEEGNNGNLAIYSSEPSGEVSSWQALAIGRNSDKNMRKLEASWREAMSTVETAQLLARTARSTQSSADNTEESVDEDDQTADKHRKHETEEASSDTVERLDAMDFYRFHRRSLQRPTPAAIHGSVGSNQPQSITATATGRKGEIVMSYYKSLEELTRGLDSEA